MKRVPIRSAGLLARCRITASSIFVPFGFFQSSGTGTVAQSSPVPQALQPIAVVPAAAVVMVPVDDGGLGALVQAAPANATAAVPARNAARECQR
jgi:hypothetical protein